MQTIRRFYAKLALEFPYIHILPIHSPFPCKSRISPGRRWPHQPPLICKLQFTGPLQSVSSLCRCEAAWPPWQSPALSLAPGRLPKDAPGPAGAKNMVCWWPAAPTGSLPRPAFPCPCRPFKSYALIKKVRRKKSTDSIWQGH